MRFLDIIERVSEKAAPGRTPTFTGAHVIMALETLSGRRPVGRNKLSQTLKIGRGVARTLVRHLDKEGLIDVSRSGMVLSKFGKAVFSELRAEIKEGFEVPKSPITVAPANFVVLVKNRAHAVGTCVDLRDEAVKAGSSGATTLIFKNKELVIPGVGKGFIGEDAPIYDLLLTKLQPEENDVIIIGSSLNGHAAEVGAKMVALKLLKRGCRGKT